MSKNELGNSVIDGLKEGKIEHMFHENLMTSAVKVTIIIPIYNSECYLDECLKSVLQQNFNNYEVICIDDGSEDNSREIVKKYAERYEFIKIIFHEKNRGLSAARNTGLKNACGKYVLFLDADDMIVPETLEELYQCAEQYNLDNIYFNMKKIYETEMQHMQSVDNPEYRHYDGVYSGQEMFCRFAEEKKMKIEACRQFFKRDFLTENSLTFYEGILHEDCLFSFLCAMKAQKVKNINKEYYIYRQHKGSIMSTISERRMQSTFIVILEIFKYWNRNKFTDSVNCAILYYLEEQFSTFGYYKNMCQDYKELEIGSFAEKNIYRLMMGSLKKKKYASLSDEKIEKLRMARYIIIFGAGRAAIDIIKILQGENINIDAVAVSDLDVSSKTVCGLDVMEIKNLMQYKNIATVIIGVTNKYRQEVEKQLTNMGFDSLMMID